ncbi:serine hydrolase [Allokutzneria multivorans]|uniref:Beta-lactamase n=1 Tax=Allokutzneria multivorans TaxID=1142134 RepID=A0ABP7RFM8_9PSEU
MATIRRRAAFGLAAAAMLGTTASPASAEPAEAPEDVTPPDAARARARISFVYRRETRRARGTWSSHVSIVDPDGRVIPAVDDNADTVVNAQSVNKIAVAVAVLDKVDRGLIRLDQKVSLTPEIIIKDGDGIFRLHKVYGDQITVAAALAALLLVSDDTAVRLCGLVCPAAELNEILRAKGFEQTQVIPVANPNRFYLGKTTARETHSLLEQLVAGKLVSADSTTFILDVLRSKDGYIDGVRRTMSTAERERVATKAGWLNSDRHEAGVIFDGNAKPMLTYAVFATGAFTGDAAANDANYGGTHPALEARARLGRAMLDAVSRLHSGSARSYRMRAYVPVNGG